MPEITLAYLKRLSAMEENASVAPWVRFELPPCFGIESSEMCILHVESTTGQLGPRTRANHELIMELRNAAPALLARLIRFMEEHDTD